MRHLVENAFLHLKRWRGIATRYAKNTASFLAAVLCCAVLCCANQMYRSLGKYLVTTLSKTQKF